MNHVLLLLFSLLLGLLSGFVGGIATGAGLLAIPGMMLIGLPPSSAIATNNLNAVSSISSAFRFQKSTKLQFKQILPLLAPAFLGSLAGSNLLLHINQHIAQKAFGVASIILVLAFTLSRNPRSNKRGKIHTPLGMIAVFLGSVFAGMFGTGGGFFMVYILCYFYGLTILEANANTKVITLAGTLSVLIIFIHAGLINFQVGVPMMLGSTLGGYVGAHVAIKKGEALVKAVFLCVVLASGIKLLV